MASKLKSQSGDKLKQKSLTSFFGKSSAVPSNNAGTTRKRVLDSSSDPPDHPTSSPYKMPRVASSVAVKDATFSRSSDGGSSFKDTPPTSDPIDVDMFSDDDEEPRPKTVCCYNLYSAIVADICPLDAN
jgi:DNA mismatch repair protein MSH6